MVICPYGVGVVIAWRTKGFVRQRGLRLFVVLQDFDLEIQRGVGWNATSPRRAIRLAAGQEKPHFTTFIN